jgi:hypothetical protein
MLQRLAFGRALMIFSPPEDVTTQELKMLGGAKTGAKTGAKMGAKEGRADRARVASALE